MGAQYLLRRQRCVCIAVLLLSTGWSAPGFGQDDRLTRAHVDADIGSMTVGVTDDRGWLLLEVPGGSFLVRTDLETLTRCAERAMGPRSPDTARIAYFDTTFASTEAITFIRIRRDTAVSAYEVIGEDGPWSRTLLLPIDAAKIIFAGMHGIGATLPASARPDAAGNVAPNTAFADAQVERQAVIRFGSPLPGAAARARSGQVQVRFVVDTAGHVDPTTFRVLSSTDSTLNDVVLNMVTRARFFPASAAGRSVRQQVSIPFTFRSN